ncbi:hypothetical protein C8J55DRAFT_61476 [Lentinula edodes]|uniref:Uncharacterized protein n=1 Tax=Lentinula lateritia TaxID=40482 RepID=A0A9W9DQT9_9AGAR|nr:hypothetical protein C8J55DRAFT_61476 [Lentinula edodes]
MAVFLSFFHTIYTFFVNIYTLISSPKARLDAVTPFFADLECGTDLRELPLRVPNGADAPRCPNKGFPVPQICTSSPSAAAPSQMPLPPLQRFAFPNYPVLCSNQSSHSICSVAASPVKTLPERPASSCSASTNSDVRSQLSSACYSHPYITPPVKKKTHKKQSPIVWFRDISSTSSLNSIQSISHSNFRRHRPARRHSLQSIKHNPCMSYKHHSARFSKVARQTSRPLSEDPVSIVRKVFVECGSEVDTEGGGARARLMNRQTARSFGGMEIVNEEEEEKEQSFSRPCIQETSQDQSFMSSYSTPDSTGPPTPPSYCFSPIAETSARASEANNVEILVPRFNTQLPYLRNQSPAPLQSLGITLPSTDTLSDKLQDQRLPPRLSKLYADHRVSVVTWSDLVSFSSYGLDMIDDHGQAEKEKFQDDSSIYYDESWNEDRSLEEFDGNEDLVTNSLEDSGIDLTAVLDSMSILVGQGLDARLLLSPPRQFCSTFTT